MALVTTLRIARCIASGSNISVGIVAAGCQTSSTFSSSARDFISSTTSAATSLRFDGSGTGSRSLLNVSMSITSAEMRSWLRSTMFQPLRIVVDGFLGRFDVDFAVGHGLGVVLEAQLDQVAAAADALQDVLDVVRERGDRLADGRQPFGLDHRLVVGRVFDRERRLVGDGDHQLEVLFRELVGRALLRACVAA